MPASMGGLDHKAMAIHCTPPYNPSTHRRPLQQLGVEALWLNSSIPMATCSLAPPGLPSTCMSPCEDHRCPERSGPAEAHPGGRAPLNGAFRSTRGVPDACTPEEFAATAGALGVRTRDTVVCYDGTGGARTWWVFARSGTRTRASSTAVSASGQRAGILPPLRQRSHPGGLISWARCRITWRAV